MTVRPVAAPFVALSAGAIWLLAGGCVRPPTVAVAGAPDGSADGSDARSDRRSDGSRDALDGAGDAGPASDVGPTGRPDGGPDGRPDGHPDRTSDSSDAADGDSGGNPGASGLELLGAPLIFAATPQGFGLSAVLRSGDPSVLRARVRGDDQSDWVELAPPASPAADVAQWSVSGLQPGRRYLYEVRATRAAEAGPDLLLYPGSAVTARAPGASFSFAILGDSHIAPRDPVPPGAEIGLDANGFQEGTLLTVAAQIAAGNPDFLMNLGDTLDFHMFGFNAPPPDGSWTRLGYLNYRRLLGDTLGNAAHFSAIGNWDGENGCNTAEEIGRSSSQRLLYLPGPQPSDNPQGGSANEDYYAFTWGDALFVVLNVMTYTPTCHLLDQEPGVPDDWTLGATQLAWLEQTLANATSRWRFLFIHHAVGGAARDYDDSAYGRGGGQAAHAGVDQDEAEVRGRRPRDQVARVPFPPRRVGDPEAAARTGEDAAAPVQGAPRFAARGQSATRQQSIDQGPLAVASAAADVETKQNLLGEWHRRPSSSRGAQGRSLAPSRPGHPSSGRRGGSMDPRVLGPPAP